MGPHHPDLYAGITSCAIALSAFLRHCRASDPRNLLSEVSSWGKMSSRCCDLFLRDFLGTSDSSEEAGEPHLLKASLSAHNFHQVLVLEK